VYDGKMSGEPAVLVDTRGVRVGWGVSVGVAVSGVGVHDGTSVIDAARVAVAFDEIGSFISAGKGLNLLFGLIYMTKIITATPTVAINTRMVKIFHANPADLFRLGGAFTFKKS
jgi:hypothetical protein